MNNTNFTILESNRNKILSSDNYNFIFDKVNGFFARWGKTNTEDPDYSPFGPEIADIEISTICNGVKGIGPCKFCYKKNTGHGKYMNFETFKKLFHTLPKTVTQIAFGIGDIEANPDMWKIFDYSRENGVIPNVTINGEGITNDIADKLVSKCGAVAVSVYDKEKSYNAIKMLSDRGLKQVNIHFMICEETYEKAFEIMNDKMNDVRLKGLNAIVLLSLKPKGRASVGNNFTRLSQEKFNTLVEYALNNHIGIGFDSCGASKFIKAIVNRKDYEQLLVSVEPCESGLFSSYFNVEGKFFPCSFAEGNDEWKDGIDVISEPDWWNNSRVVKWRNDLLANKRLCPMYEI